jgi:hypothetical protein
MAHAAAAAVSETAVAAAALSIAAIIAWFGAG